MSGNGNGETRNGGGNGLWRRLRGLLRRRNGDGALRDSIVEILDEIEERSDVSEPAQPIGDDERIMLTNILKLRHLSAYDVMVPRADIVAVDSEIGLDDLVQAMTKAGHSRMPVYRETLDDVIGLVHIKDVIACVRDGGDFDLRKLIRKVLVVAPSMRVLDLLLEMRLMRVHMALVVDEFGGIDGLITIEDLVEEIVGEIEDEHDTDEGPRLIPRPDGTLLADARATIEEFEALVGPVLSLDEREEDIDTLGGLIFALADRVPARGELILHPESGICFEVVEADPRRVKRLRVRNLPQRSEAADARS